MHNVLFDPCSAVLDDRSMPRVYFAMERGLHSLQASKICVQVLKNGSALSKDVVTGEYGILVFEEEDYMVCGVAWRVHSLQGGALDHKDLSIGDIIMLPVRLGFVNLCIGTALQNIGHSADMVMVFVRKEHLRYGRSFVIEDLV